MKINPQSKFCSCKLYEEKRARVTFPIDVKQTIHAPDEEKSEKSIRGRGDLIIATREGDERNLSGVSTYRWSRRRNKRFRELFDK